MCSVWYNCIDKDLLHKLTANSEIFDDSCESMLVPTESTPGNLFIWIY